MTATVSAPDKKSSPNRFLASLRDDVLIGLSQRDFWFYQARQKVRLQYARSLIGPFWLTLTMLLQLVALTYLFTGLFGAPLEAVGPWVTIGVIVWTLLSTTLNESTSTLLAHKPYMMEGAFSVSGFVFGALMKNVFVSLHHLVLLVGLVIWFRMWPNENWAWLLASLPLFLLTLMSLGIALAVLTARFNDLRPLTENILMIGFFLTPVLWRPQALLKNEFIATYNPLTHLLAIIRDPLLGHAPSTLSWLVSLGTCIGAVGAALILLGLMRDRIALWI